MNRFVCASLVTSLSLLMPAPAARAADGAWGVDAGGNWSSAGNWAGNIVATGTGSTAYFTNTITADRVVTIDYAGPLALGNLHFDAPAGGWTLSGGALLLSPGAGPSFLKVNAGTSAIESSLAGAAGIVKEGAGTLVLSGSNTYAGATIVSNGTLKLARGAGGAPGGFAAYYSFDDVSALVVNNGGSGGAAYNGNLSGATVTSGGRVGNAMAEAISSTQAMTIATAIPLASGQWTVSAWFNGLYTNGSGNGWSALFQCSNLNDWPVIEQQSNTRLGTYSGGLGDSGYALSAVATGWHQVTAVSSGGVVRFFIDGAYVGQAAKNVTSSLATVGNARNAGYTQPWAQKIDEVYIYTNALTDLQVTQLYHAVDGGSGLPPGTALAIESGAILDLNGLYQSVGSLSDAAGGGGFLINGTANPVTFTAGGNDGSTAFSGVIAGSLRLAKVGAGVLTLSGGNSFDGGVAIEGGTLSVGADTHLGAAGGSITLSGGTLEVTGSFMNGAGSRLLSVPAASVIRVAAGQTYVLSNAFLAGSSGALTKSGDGTLVLGQSSGANNLTGVVTVNGGTLIAQGSVGDGTIRNHVVVNSGGTFRLVSANAIINSCVMTVHAGGVFDMSGSGGETIAFYAGAGTITNQNTGMTLSLGNATNDFSGNIHGTGSLVINNNNGGAGVQILSGTNRLAGSVSIQGGVLSVSQDDNLGAPGAKLNLLGGTLRITGSTLTNLDMRAVNWTNLAGTLDIADAAHVFTVTNEIAGTGTVAKAGAGTLVLAASNSYTGATAIRGGTLALGPAGALSSLAVDVYAGAQLTIAAATALPAGSVLNVAVSGGYGRIALSNGTPLTVAQLKFDGALQASGTWGATGSGAANIDDNIFSGPGLLNVLTGLGAPAHGSWVQDASGHWGELTNWMDGVIAYGTNSTAYFTNAITGDRTVNLGYPSLAIGHLHFSAATNDWNLTNNTLQLAVSTGTPNITVAARTARIGSVLAGGQGLAKSGTGTLALDAANTYAGGTAVNAGALNLRHNTALGAGGAATVAGGARMELQNNVTIAGVTNTLLGDGGNTFGALQTAGGSNTWAGPLVIGNATARIGVGSATGGTLVVSGSITDGGSNFPLTVRGQSSTNSRVILTGGAGYGGNTEVSGARLQLGGDNRLNTAGSLSNRNIAAVVDLAGFSQTVHGLGVPNNGGRLDITNSGAGLSTLVISNTAYDTMSAGSVAGAVGVTKRGAGTQEFAGLNNVHTGPTLVEAGTLVVSGGVVNGSVSLGAGGTLVARDGQGLAGEYYNESPNSGNYVSLPALQGHFAGLNPYVLYNLARTGTNFDFAANGSNFPPGVSNINIGARWIGKFQAPVSGTYYFNIASDDGSMLWIDGSQVVNNNFGQAITGRANTVTLAAGVHDIAIAYYQGGGSYGFYADVALPGGATNRLPGALLSSGPAIGSLSGAAGSSIDLSGGSLIVAQTNDGTFAGTLAGTNELRKIGAATLTLAGTNTAFSGPILLQGGRLAIDRIENLGMPGGRLTFDGGILRITGTALGGLDARAINTNSFLGGIDVADPAGLVTFTNALGGSSAFAKYGPGKLIFTGNHAYTGGTTVAGGTLVLAPSISNALGPVTVNGGAAGAALDIAGTTDLGVANLVAGGAATDRSKVTITSDASMARLLAGTAVTSAAAIYQMAGNVAVGPAISGQDVLSVGMGGGYGYYLISGGTVTAGQLAAAGSANDATGVFEMKGGLARVPSSGGWILAGGWGNNSKGVINLYDGTLVGPPSGNAVTLNVFANKGAFGYMNLLGPDALLVATNNANGVNILGGSGNTNAAFNLNAGTAVVSRVYQAAAGSAQFNFDGGTLRAGRPVVNLSLNSGGASYVYGGGAFIDTFNNAVIVSNALLAPTGSGVTAIPVSSGGSGYIGAPVVVITGGSGSGATAVAQMDLAAGTLTNILITSRGVNYAGTPTVTLYGGGFTTAATLGTPLLAANAGGGLTKLGQGTLTLASTNTYTGLTTVQNGLLLVSTTNAIQGPITVLTNTSTVGPTYPLDQNFINWLTTRLTGGVSPGIVVISTNTASPIDLSALPGTSLGAAGGNWTFSGSLTIPGTNLYLGNAGGTLVYAPNIGTGTNVFIGYNGNTTFPPVGAVQLNGTNATYTGAIEVVSGTLKAGITNSLGGASSVVNVWNGSTLDVNGYYVGNAQINVIGKGVNTNGAIVNTRADAIPAMINLRLVGDATFGGPFRWDIRAGGGSPVLDLAGFTMTKTNGNTVAALGCLVTDGNMLIDQGLFRFEQNTSVTSGVGQITIGPAGTLDYWSFSGVCTRPITVNGGTLSVGSGTAIVGSPITLAGATNLIIPARGALLYPTNLISGGGALQKLGGGTLRLPIPATHAGRTVVGPGILELAVNEPAAGALPASSELVVNNGGTVQLDFDRAIFGAVHKPINVCDGGSLSTSNGLACHLDHPLTLAGGIIAGGTPHATLGNWILQTNLQVSKVSSVTAPRLQLDVAGGVVFDVTGGAQFVVSGRLEDPAGGTGSLIKAGSGMLTINGTNTYGGPTIVADGTLKLSAIPVAAGVALWLDAADGASVVRDGAGNVSQWFDKSGNGRNATQATNGLQPRFVTNALLGRTVVNFSGSPQLMNADLSFLANNGYSIFAVEGRTNNGNLYFLGTQGGGVGNQSLHFGYRTSTNFTLAQLGNDLTTSATLFPAFTAQQFRVWDGIFDLGNQYLYLDTTNVASRGTTAPFLPTLGPGVVGCGYGTQYFQGDIAEILIYNRAVSAVERQQIEGYLRDKWFGATPPALADLLPPATPLRIASGATVDLGGVSQSVGSIADHGGGGGRITNTVSLAVRLTFGSDNTSTAFSGSIYDGAAAIGLAKVGTGTQALDGVSTCSGNAYVSNGTLLVNGTIACGNTFLDSGATLGGSGVVGGHVYSLGGEVSPGASPGVLTILGDFFQYGALNIEIAGTLPGSGYDRLVVGGTATLFAGLVVTTNGYAPVAGDSFTILTASNGVVNTFAFTTLPELSTGNGWVIDYQPNAVVLSVTGAPPTAAGYDVYAAQIPNAADRGYQNDPDGDGYANLLEYATGGNPTNADTTARMSAARTNGLLALRFTRATNATDATLIVEGSHAATNNAAWAGIATNLAGSWGGAPNVTEAGTSTPVIVTVADTVPASTNRFLRLRVTRP